MWLEMNKSNHVDKRKIKLYLYSKYKFSLSTWNNLKKPGKKEVSTGGLPGSDIAEGMSFGHCFDQ